MWTPDGLLRDGVVEVDADGRIGAVRPARAGDPDAADGLILPGLVNAHTHLELSWMAGQVPGGDGFFGWVQRLMLARNDQPADLETPARAAAQHLVDLGTAVISDVGNGGDTAALLLEAPLAGVVQHELLTLDAHRLGERLERARSIGAIHQGPAGPVLVRPAAHALYSTAPLLVRAVVRHRGPGAAAPASLHVAESADELDFVARGEGPFALLLDQLGVDWRWWEAPGTTPVRFLDELGLLGPQLLAVHGVLTTAGDRALLARSKTPLCLCPRSNLHITDALPDVPALLAAGVLLCLGTDSLASSPDLDVLGEAATLADAFPEVPAGTWIHLATAGGADALGFTGYGRIRPGTSPGLLLLEGAGDPQTALSAVTTRRWLERPGGAP